MTSRFVRPIVTAAALVVVSSAGHAQATPPAIDFSGTIYGAYSYRTDSAAKAGLGGKSPNAFSVDRAYLTFRMPAGDNGAIRVTTDVFQNTNTAQNAYYQGWVVRIKYAYLQYTGLRNEWGNGSSLVGRLGILHTVVIDYEESLWPRYLNQVSLEKNGFFSSSDAGIAGQLTLGNRWGEIYATATNGGGYTTYDRDRFKDFGIRASITPFANKPEMSRYLRYLSITPWYYKGWTGSAFQSGGPGQVGPGTNGAITDGLQRDRLGLFAAIKDTSSCDFRNGGRCKLVVGAEFAQRMDEGESGANTGASPRVAHDSTGRIFDAFAFIRPIEVFDPSQRSNFTFIARWDRFTPNTSPSSANYAGTTPGYNFYLLGASYDLTQRMTFTLDYQNQSPTSYPSPTGTNVRPTPQSATMAMHFVVNF